MSFRSNLVIAQKDILMPARVVLGTYHQVPLTLQQIIDIAAEQWPLDEQTYPDMKGYSEPEKKMMAIRHVLLHMIKLSDIAELVEQFEHGRYRTELDPDYHLQLLQRARKMAFNSLRLLALLNEQGANLEYWLTHKEARAS